MSQEHDDLVERAALERGKMLQKMSALAEAIQKLSAVQDGENGLVATIQVMKSQQNSQQFTLNRLSAILDGKEGLVTKMTVLEDRRDNRRSNVALVLSIAGVVLAALAILLKI